MSKQFIPLADLPKTDGPGSGPAELVRVAPGSASDSRQKSFQLTRRFEYQRIDRVAADGLLGEAELNAMGNDGWELAGVVSAADGVHYYLKRTRGG